MGSMASAELNHSDRPCAVIQLRTWKGADMEKVVVVPVTEATFDSSSDHPLFQLLLTARNEPAVRHWQNCCNVSERKKSVRPIDRTKEVEPELSAEDFYSELFPAAADDLPSVSSSTSSRSSRSSSSSSLTKASVQHSRWMLLTMNTSATPEASTPFLTVDQVTRLAQSGQLSAAGFLEGRHTPLCTTLCSFMVKTFSNEARSQVIFQVVAFMEARRLASAHLSPVSPSTVEFTVRSGDLSSLRMLEHTFRKVLPIGNSQLHPFVTVSPCSTPTFLRVRVSVEALGDIMQQLESAIDTLPTTDTSADQCDTLCLTVDQRPCARFPTPFESFIQAAKSVWSSENAIVTSVQPNVRQPQPISVANSAITSVNASEDNTPKAVTREQSNASSAIEHSRTSSSGNTDSEGPNTPPVTPPVNPRALTADGAICPPPPAGHKKPHETGSSVSRRPMTIPTSPKPVVKASRPCCPPEPTFLRLPHNTPVHVWQPDTATWEASWLCDNGARLEMSARQDFILTSNRCVLETWDTLSLSCDQTGRPITVSCTSTDGSTAAYPTYLAIQVGCPAEEVGSNTGIVHRNIKERELVQSWIFRRF